MRLRALIVDDEPLARGWLRNLLDREADVEVVGEAGDGFRAVLAVQELRPDVVFLDVQMPGLDGPATLAQLRADPRTAAIPVVFLTAGARGAALADAGINIDDVRNPHDEKGTQSIAILKVNRPVPDDVIRNIAKDIKAHTAFCAEL